MIELDFTPLNLEQCGFCVGSPGSMCEAWSLVPDNPIQLLLNLPLNVSPSHHVDEGPAEVR